LIKPIQRSILNPAKKTESITEVEFPI
jgi:hypothetical protein